MPAVESQSAEQPKLNTACPQCGDSNSQPCHAVWAAGTSSISTTTRGGGLAIGSGNQLTPMFGSGSTSGVQQTQMAAQCSPPVYHPPMGMMWLGSLSGLIGAISLLVILGNGPHVGSVACMVVFGGVCAWAMRVFSRRNLAAAAIFNPTMLAWRRRWICHKCHHQFDPTPSSPSTSGT